MQKVIKRLNIPPIVILIVIFAFILRIAWLPSNLFFGWEQGRDFLKLKEIASGDLTLVGPKTDIGGVFHGALSYYIPLIPYLIFQGNPFLVLLSFIAVNSLAIFALYKVTSEMFSKRIATLAAVFYAVSYSAVIYARWLSNPNLVPALTIFFFYFLWQSRKNWKYLFVSLICWFIIFHLIVVAALSLIAPTLLFLSKEKVKLSVGRIFALLSLAPVMLLSYILFEVKNNFLMIRSFLADSRSHGNFLTSSLGLVDQFINEVVDSIFPTSPRFAFLVFVAVIFIAIRISNKSKENLIALGFLLATPFLFLFVSDSPLRHFFITVPVFLSILLAIVVDHLLKTKKKRLAYGLIVIVVIGNLIAIKKRLPESEANFIHHAQRTYLSDMINLIDYAYVDANGTEFTYDYYSMPYWKEDAWIYLFQWYGKGKYGYAPQVDRTNVDRSEVFYTFIEPNETAKIHQDNWYGEYKKGLELIDTFESGKLYVEKRREKEIPKS